MKKNYIRLSLILTIFLILNTCLTGFIPIFLSNTNNFNEKSSIKLSSPGKTPLWNYTTKGSVNQVAISSDGNYIAAGSNDNKTYLFDKSTSTPIWNYTIGGEVESIALSSDGNYIAAGTGGLDNKVYLFQRSSNIPIWNYSTGGVINSIAISSNGNYIVAASKDLYLFF